MAMSADEARRKANPATYPTASGGWCHSSEFFRLRYGSVASTKRIPTKGCIFYTSVNGQEVVAYFGRRI